MGEQRSKKRLAQRKSQEEEGSAKKGSKSSESSAEKPPAKKKRNKGKPDPTEPNCDVDGVAPPDQMQGGEGGDGQFSMENLEEGDEEPARTRKG